MQPTVAIPEQPAKKKRLPKMSLNLPTSVKPTELVNTHPRATHVEFGDGPQDVSAIKLALDITLNLTDVRVDQCKCSHRHYEACEGGTCCQCDCDVCPNEIRLEIRILSSSMDHVDVGVDFLYLLEMVRTWAMAVD